MLESFKGKKITIMGLGLHGGGLATAKFFLDQGAILTITDLRSKEILQPTINELSGFNITYVLGEHRERDFLNADIVIKNPGVPRTSRFLKLAKRIESDISIFLLRTDCPIIGITGSKGKSSTVSAIYHVLKNVYPKTKLGGNITVSPLTFINEVDQDSLVILELSSWQLRDLKDKSCFHPHIAAVTNIMNDHQNAYSSLDEYAQDKSIVFDNIDSTAILNYNDSYKEFFQNKLSVEPLFFSNTELDSHVNGAYLDTLKQGWVQIEGLKTLVLPHDLDLKGEHQRENLLLAGLVLYLLNVDGETICNGLKHFKGIPHRMEFIKKINGVSFYNDSAATIPQAVYAALDSFKNPVVLITGGTDKSLDFKNISSGFSKAKSIYLLKGSATDKMIVELNRGGIKFEGPFNSLETLLDSLIKNLQEGDSVILSPGATSFGMFKNEFDRGNQFKAIISKI